jgi:hypothetical protein
MPSATGTAITSAMVEVQDGAERDRGDAEARRGVVGVPRLVREEVLGVLPQRRDRLDDQEDRDGDR